MDRQTRFPLLKFNTHSVTYRGARLPTSDLSGAVTRPFFRKRYPQSGLRYQQAPQHPLLGESISFAVWDHFDDLAGFDGLL